MDFAADEAQGRGTVLHLVCAYSDPPTLSKVAIAPYLRDRPELRGPDPYVSAVLARIGEDVQHRYPGLQVLSSAAAGRPSLVLTKESHRADLLVVSARGHGGFAELLTGSVATQVATHAACPVIIMRGTPIPTGPVIAGIDALPRTEAVCAFAFAEAAWRGVPLHAVHVWGPQLTNVADIPAAHRGAERLLIETLTGWRKKYPQVKVVESLIYADHPAETLVAASQGASLITVGSRNHRRLVSLLLGSSSRILANHAGCPVAIIRTMP